MAAFLIIDGDVLDWDLDALEEILEVIDGQIDRLFALWAQENATGRIDPADMWTRMEYVAGIGFVACQNYLTQVYPPMDKGEALRRGPLHRSGRSVASIVNAAANQWKHEGEWLGDAASDPRRRSTEAVLGAVTGDGSPNLFELLTQVVEPQPPRFRSLVPLLAQWRDGFVEGRTR